MRPLPLVRNLKATHPNADAYFQFARNTVGAMSRNFPAPLQCVEASRQSVEAEVRRRHEATSASSSPR